MKLTLLAILILLCSLPLYAQQRHTFATQGDPEVSASRYTEASASDLSTGERNEALAPGVCPPNCQPSFFRAAFTLARTGDTFLDIRDLGKGALWINGHAIGRFWNVGPQQTLYIPGPWLRKGRNQITVFDLAPQSEHPHVAGLAQPILNGPVADPTTSKQE